MENYVNLYNDGEAPFIVKKNEISSTETITEKILSVNLSYDDFCLIPDDVVTNHLNNLTSYIKQQSSSIELIDPGSPSSEGWPLLGWQKIQEANTELVDWWSKMQLKKIEERELEDQDNAGETL